MNETRGEKPDANIEKIEDAARKRPAEDADRSKSAEPTVVTDPGFPDPQGLYNPANEKDACGVGFIADM